MCFLTTEETQSNEQTNTAAQSLDVWHMQDNSSLGLQSADDKLIVIMMSHHSL